MRPTGSLMSWLVVLLSFAYVSTAIAQSGPAAPDEDAKKRASERFRSGVDLFQEGAYRAALVEFERANEIAPDYRLLYNIGQVQFQLGDYLSATHSYERYLVEGGAEVSRARRSEVEAALKILNQRVGRVSIKSNADGAEIFVDDLAVGVTPLPNTVVVNVGRHRVYARGADGSTSTEVIDVAGGDLREVQLVLKAPAVTLEKRVAKGTPLSLKRKLAIGAWAASGALALSAVMTGLRANSKIDARKKELKDELPDQDKLRRLGDSAGTLALTTDVLAGLAISGVAAGAALWIFGGQAAPAPADAGPTLSWSVGLRSVSAVGTF